VRYGGPDCCVLHTVLPLRPDLSALDAYCLLRYFLNGWFEEYGFAGCLSAVKSKATPIAVNTAPMINGITSSTSRGPDVRLGRTLHWTGLLDYFFLLSLIPRRMYSSNSLWLWHVIRATIAARFERLVMVFSCLNLGL
jgi:hypothetical protein